MSYCSLRDYKIVSKFPRNVARPKSDLASLANFGVGAFGLRKVGKLDKSFREYAVAQQENQRQTMRGLQTIAELQVASMYMLREVDVKLAILSDIAWDISNYLQRKEQKDEFLGDLRLVIRAINTALDDIGAISETNLEYATLQIEILLELVEHHDVRIEHFKHSHEDMDRAEVVLTRLNSTHRDYLQRLEDE